MKRYLLFVLLLCTFTVSKGQYLYLLSPNGGETFAIGSSQSITWASIGINLIDIEYSSNNGTSYSMIDTSVLVFSNSYTWQVSGPTTTNGLIRIKESTTGTLVDVSSATFNVVNPSLSITFPILASVFNPGQQVNITWNGLIASNFVTLFFSSNNGSTYDTIASNVQNFYNYDWTVPSVASTNCIIKIVDAASIAVQNLSPTFTIQALPSSGTILTPNGGENLFSTNNYNITWNVSGTNIVDLEYTSDGGINWIPIAQNLASTPSNYTWNLPSLNSSNAKVRLKNAINGLVLDESNNAFSIMQPTPSLYLSSPFGYENWAIGSSQSIQWTYSFISSIKIEYSTNGGSTFNLIGANIPASNLSYIWTIPASVSSNCIIKITDNNSALISQNQNPFSIVNPSITLQTPNGGEFFNSNVDTLITWNGNLVSNLIKIEYSINNGVSWNLVANNIPNTNFYHWLVPNTPSANCKVRISDAQNPSIIDASINVFTITIPTPIINLLSPNGSEQWAIGTYQTIFWSSVNIANVKIEYSPNNGLTWSLISQLEPAASGSYNWLVNVVSSNNARVKVSNAANTSVNDTSTQVFQIYAPTTYLDLLYPNGGEQLPSGLTSTITWNSLGIGNIALEYSVNNGINWQLIVAGISSTLGSYDWLIPSLNTNTLKVRIRAEVDPTLNDESASFISIIQPTINFVSFPAGTNYTLFSNMSLFWSSTGLNNQLLRLEYSVNNGLSWVTFASGLQNTSIYNWLINCPPTAACIFRISVENSPSVNAISQGSINVSSSGPAIIVLTPGAQTTVNSGSIYPITWNSYGVNYVRIEYRINGNPNYQLITQFTPASTGSFNWNVPANLNATDCSIKISNAANTNLSAQTPFSFNIQTGQFFMISGNYSFGNVINAGQNYPIDWSSTAVSGYVNLAYSLDSLNWNSIINNYPNTGNYNWLVPYISTNSLWYKVEDQLNSNIFDVNNSPQIIVIADSTLNLVNPADGASILSGNNYTIIWSASGINLIDIEFSDNNGANWNSIATELNASLGYYNWNVPNVNTNNALIRIKNSINSQQNAENQLPFTISNSLLNIISPNGGEVWNTNASQYITWQSLGVDFVNLYFSSDAGATFQVIDTNIYNIGYYNWQTPSISGSNYRIKIVDSNNPYFADTSNVNFTLNNLTSSITLLSPNGGEQLQTNTGTYITWQSNGVTPIDISLSLNGGLIYTPIATNVAAIPANYYWLIPDTLSLATKIKISSSINSSISDVSNANFSIINDSVQLQLLSPNGGEVYNSNSYQTIKWSNTNAPFVKLYYSTNGGTTYTYINSVINDSLFIWLVPTNASSNCKIKVENGNDASVFDVTNNLFTINNQAPSSNSILIDSLSSNNICSGSSLPISFSTSGLFITGNQFRVHLSNINGSFNTFTDIGGITANTGGTVQCIIPTQILNGGLYSLRIVADNPALVGSNYNYGNLTINKANANFSSDKQLVLFPNTTVNFQPNSPSNSIASSNWNTGNSGNYTTINAQHNFNIAGKYDVLHTITDTSGCSATIIINRMISVEHWFPNAEINANSSEEIIDIDFENIRYGCAIFKNGNCIVTTDSGNTWTLSFTNSNMGLNSITTINNAWYISLEDGAYLKSNNRGGTWVKFTINNSESLNDIFFISSNIAYAVGKNGKILKYNGTSWQNQNAGTGAILNQIANKNNTTIIVGNNATILKQNNNLWTAINAPVNTNFNAICLNDSLRGYIVGDFGFILKTSDAGNSWNVSLSGADVNFNNVICSGDSVWAIGNEGVIYTSINNGLTWKRFSIGVTNNLNSITYINKKGFIVGMNGLLRTFNQTEFVPVINQLSETQSVFFVNIFPNPTLDNLNIRFTNIDTQNDLMIKISDIQGKLVEDKRIANAASNGLYNINLAHLKSGIYFLSVITDNKHQTFKIVKSEQP